MVDELNMKPTYVEAQGGIICHVCANSFLAKLIYI